MCSCTGTALMSVARRMRVSRERAMDGRECMMVVLIEISDRSRLYESVN